jgi:rubrerythrin
MLLRDTTAMRTTLVLLAIAAAPLVGLAQDNGNAAATLKNLQTAYRGESNAHQRYLAFAQKADEEEYSGVASLFRAAARAEEIHAANHAIVIRKLGGVPDAQLEEPVTSSTRENIEVAIKGETYERDQMYPDFLRQAGSGGNAEAERTFTLALAAETEHAKLLQNALDNLETFREARVFYVCPVCGFTASEPNFDSCPSCATPKERFEQVR